jgi:ribose transport system substrate-binding protein
VRQLLRILIISFALLSLVSFLGSFLLIRQLRLEAPSEDEAASYHFSLYLPDNRNSFFTAIIEGAERAVAER